jgi:hypothetical protein
VVRCRGVRHEQEHSSPSRTRVGEMGEIAADFRMHAGWTFIKTAGAASDAGAPYYVGKFDRTNREGREACNIGPGQSWDNGNARRVCGVDTAG